MAFSHGKDFKIRLGSTGTPGTLVDISAYCNSVAFPSERETAETTTFNKASKTRIAGLRDGSFSFEGFFDPTVDAQLDGVLKHPTASTLVSFEVTPQVGGPVYTGTCIVTSYETSGDVGGVVTFSAEAEISGDVTRT
jgi:predicted secreted protein